MGKMVKRGFLTIFVLCLLTGLLFLAPTIMEVVELKKEADEIVSNCDESTFKNAQTTLVYDSSGKELCKIKSEKDLYYVSFDEIPVTLTNAFVVMEDRDFYTHDGVDYFAIIRAVIEDVKSKDIVQGASTITQQLVKNIFLTSEVTWQRKVKEIFISWGIEKKFEKEQILEYYLNNIYFGNGYYGVEAAARGYFNKSCSQLTLAEQVFLAAIPNNPSRYNPYTKYENARDRGHRILEQMYESGCIGSMDYLVNKDSEVTVVKKNSSGNNSSVVTYVRHCATETLMDYYGFSFRYNFSSEEDYQNYLDIYELYYTKCQQMLLSGGYTIYTSIDMSIQNLLQSAIDNNTSQYTEVSSEGVYKLQSAGTCIDNTTGYVKAIVGSRTQEEIVGFTLNRAYQSFRQSGSAVKPLLVYTPYFQLGNTPDTIVSDTPFEYGPNNADGVFSGDITVREAVMKSKNTVAWSLYENVITPSVGIGFLMQMHFKKVWYDKDNVLGSLGGFTYGVTTEEMAGAFATLCNDGVYRNTTCVMSMKDNSGKELVDNSDRETRIYESNASQMMTDVLTSVALPGATGQNGAVDGVTLAVKTGSTNNNYDLWYCGFSAYYTTSIWVGYDYPSELNSDGGRAAYIFKDFMENVHKGLPDVKLPLNGPYSEENIIVVPQRPSLDEILSGEETVVADPDEDATQIFGDENAFENGGGGNLPDVDEDAAISGDADNDVDTGQTDTAPNG